MEERDPRLCTKRKADGNLCGAYALKDGSRLCPGHAGKGIAASPAAFARQGAEQSAQTRRDRAAERRMTPAERLRAVAAREEAALAERLVALALNGDPGVSLQAIKLIHERLYGRPTQPVEHSEDTFTALRRTLTPQDVAELRAQLQTLRELPEQGDATAGS